MGVGGMFRILISFQNNGTTISLTISSIRVGHAFFFFKSCAIDLKFMLFIYTLAILSFDVPILKKELSAGDHAQKQCYHPHWSIFWTTSSEKWGHHTSRSRWIFTRQIDASKNQVLHCKINMCSENVVAPCWLLCSSSFLFLFIYSFNSLIWKIDQRW